MIDLIAKEANVSVSTVSKALNGYCDISEKTRKKIMKIAEEMNYAPMSAARNLAIKKSNTIGLIVSTDDTPVAGEIIYKMIIQVKKVCEQKNYEFVLITTDTEKQKKLPLVNLCNEYKLAGCIIEGLFVDDPYCEQVQEIDVPCAIIDNVICSNKKEEKNNRIAVATTDNYNAVRQILTILVNKGHQYIGFINGDHKSDVSTFREDGYRSFVKDNNLTLNPDYIRYGNFKEDQACDELKCLLTLCPEITAVFCASDKMAIGAYKGAEQLGLKIPADIAIIGFDGIELGEYVTPKLTTVVQNFGLMAKTGCENLIRMIEGEEVENITYIPYNIRLREST